MEITHFSFSFPAFCSRPCFSSRRDISFSSFACQTCTHTRPHFCFPTPKWEAFQISRNHPFHWAKEWGDGLEAQTDLIQEDFPQTRTNDQMNRLASGHTSLVKQICRQLQSECRRNEWMKSKRLIRRLWQKRQICFSIRQCTANIDLASNLLPLLIFRFQCLPPPFVVNSYPCGGHSNPERSCQVELNWIAPFELK